MIQLIQAKPIWSGPNQPIQYLKNKWQIGEVQNPFQHRVSLLINAVSGKLYIVTVKQSPQLIEN